MAQAHQNAAQQDIYNMALGHISVGPVSDINESSRQADACNTYWSAVIRTTLRENKWRFCCAQVTMAQSANYTPINWTYAYAYPANCIRLWRVFNQYTTLWLPWGWNNACRHLGEKFEELYDPTNNQRVVVTNCQQAIAEYNVPVDDTTLFDPSFVRVASLGLAASICPLLLNDDVKTDAIIKLYNLALSDAQRHNAGEENTEKNFEHSDFLDARGGGGPVSPKFWDGFSTSSV